MQLALPYIGKSDILYIECLHNSKGGLNMLGERLRELRKLKKFTQADMAKKLSVAQNTYNGYETGKSNPPLEVIVKIADLLSITLDYLLGRTDIPEQVVKRDIIDDLSVLEKKELYRYAKYLKIRSTLEGSGGSPESSATSDVS